MSASSVLGTRSEAGVQVITLYVVVFRDLLILVFRGTLHSEKTNMHHSEALSLHQHIQCLGH